MVRNYNIFQINKEIKKNFFQQRLIPEKYKVNPDKLFGYIYCIENKLNGKKYVGSTYSQSKDNKLLSKRVNQYIYDYHVITEGRADKLLHISSRPVNNAIAEEGIENFVMYPIAETTKDTHKELEKYFIISLNTLSPNGYNSTTASIDPTIPSFNINKSMSIDEKLKRSDPIFAVNFLEESIIIADSMKLFADYIDSSKDMIKNVVRRCRTYKNWYVLYRNKFKREEVLNKLLNDDINGDSHSLETKEEYQMVYNSLFYNTEWEIYISPLYKNFTVYTLTYYYGLTRIYSPNKK